MSKYVGVYSHLNCDKLWQTVTTVSVHDKPPWERQMLGKKKDDSTYNKGRKIFMELLTPRMPLTSADSISPLTSHVKIKKAMNTLGDCIVVGCMQGACLMTCSWRHYCCTWSPAVEHTSKDVFHKSQSSVCASWLAWFEFNNCSYL